MPQARCAVPKGFEIDPTLRVEDSRSLVLYKGLRMCLEPRSAQEYFEAIVARSAVSGAKGIKIFLTLRNFCRDSCIASCHTPPTRSFSINGLRLTNAKTSFAAGFGLHHWSILEGELTRKPGLFATASRGGMTNAGVLSYIIRLVTA